MATSYTFRPIITSGLILSLDAENLKSYVSGSNWYDLTSNNNNGVLTNGPTFEFNGVASFIFNGVDNYVVTDNIYGPTEFTICVWCKVDYDGSDTYGRIVEKGFNSEWSLNLNKFPGFIGNNKFNFQYFDNANIVISNTSIDPSKYQYVVCTIQDNGGGNKTGTIYVDGVFDNSGTRNETLLGQNAPITIGSQLGAISIASLKGNISVVQYYGRVLTPKEVLQNYNALKHRFDNLPIGIVTNGLVLNLDAGNPASYPGTGTTWYDLTINNNNGTLINGPTFDSNNGGSLLFDGVNDYVSIYYDVSKIPSGTQSISVNAWFLPTRGYSIGEEIVGIGSNSYIGSRLAIGLANNLYIEGLNTAIYESIPFDYGSMSWINVSFTTNSGPYNVSDIKLYVNGYIVPISVLNDTLINIDPQEILIGAIPNSGVQGAFKGNISNIQIYNRELTSSEVLQNYNAIKNRY